jgi:hypothetical protein
MTLLYVHSASVAKPSNQVAATEAVGKVRAIKRQTMECEAGSCVEAAMTLLVLDNVTLQKLCYEATTLEGKLAAQHPGLHMPKC